MKQTLFILFFFLVCSRSAFATECTETVFKEGNVQLFLCQNYSNYHQTRALLYKARTKALHKYIKHLTASDLLAPKKFELHIYDELLTYNHLEITQSKDVYSVKLSGFATGEELLSIANYCTSKSWKPFQPSNYREASNNKIAKEKESFYSEYKVVDAQNWLNGPDTLWKLTDFSLQYLKDSLHYFFGTTKIPVVPNAGLPVTLKNRMLFFQEDHVFVFEKDEMICSTKIIPSLSEDLETYVFSDWVNIGIGGKEHWLYSYSYKQNKFYERRK